MIGCCTLVKPFYAAFLLVPVAFVAGDRTKPVRKAISGATVVLAAAVPPLLAIAWFCSRGALDSFHEVHVLYASAYADSLRPDLVARRIYNYFFSTGSPTPTRAVAVLLPAIGYGLYALLRESRQHALTFAAWLGIALFCVAIQGKFWVYHWAPTFPPFVALAAIG